MHGGARRFLVTAQVGLTDQACGPSCAEKRRRIRSNPTTDLIPWPCPGHGQRGYLGRYPVRALNIHLVLTM